MINPGTMLEQSMKPTKLVPILAITSIALLSTTVVTAQPPHKSQRMINHLDKDGDDLVSIEEFEVPSRGREHNRLVTADRDGDGNVSRSEMQDQIDERAEQAIERFELADLNDDDFLTEEEIKMAAFSSIDRNDDGYIDADELSAVRRSAKHRRPS